MKQKSALRVVEAVIGMWTHAQMVQMVEQWRAQAAMEAEQAAPDDTVAAATYV